LYQIFNIHSSDFVIKLRDYCDTLTRYNFIMNNIDKIIKDSEYNKEQNEVKIDIKEKLNVGKVLEEILHDELESIDYEYLLNIHLSDKENIYK